MPRQPVYSTLFFAANPANVGLTTVGGPAGTDVWDIRNVVAINSNQWFQSASGFWVQSSEGAMIAWATDPDVYNGRLYNYDVRQVLEVGQQLLVLAGDGSWSIRISGYLLTNP